MRLPVEMISQPGQLDVTVRELADSKAIALDTESNSRHRYPEQLCLIQIATVDKIYIIDTLLIKDITPLKDILFDSSITKVIHGADYDIRSLDRHCGLRLRNIYDTTIAARFSGITRFGLAALIEDLLGTTIEKNKRLQQADWGRRPLSAEALDYAAADVRHLLALREILDQRLQTLERMAWVTEEFTRLEDIRYEAPDLKTAYLSVKGANKLADASLGILRTLFSFREKEAFRQHRPHYFIIPNATLIYLAAHPTAGLSEVPGLGATGRKRYAEGIQQAIKKGLTAPPVQRLRTSAKEHIDEDYLKRLKHLKSWRTTIADSLSLDPSLLWPAVSLERLAKEPNTFKTELTSGDVRRWQRDHFASSLAAQL